MRKTIIIGLMALASMMCNTSFAQDIYKTAARRTDGTTQQWYPYAAIRIGYIYATFR